jgi:hypothetical protein
MDTKENKAMGSAVPRATNGITIYVEPRKVRMAEEGKLEAMSRVRKVWTERRPYIPE